MCPNDIYENPTEYDILQDEELMRLIGLSALPDEQAKQAHVEPTQPPVSRSRKKPARAKARTAKASAKDSSGQPRSAIRHRLWWFSVAACLYLEWLLFFAIPGKTVPAFFAATLFAFAASQLCYLLVSLLHKPVIQRIFGGILLAVGAFFFGLEYFIAQTFQNFMNLSSILSSTKDVVGSYSGSIWSILLGGWWMVLLLLLPLIVWLVLGKKLFAKPQGLSDKRGQVRMALSAALLPCAHLLAVAVICLNPTMKTGYTEHPTSLTFDKHIRSFGLFAAARLDLQNTLLGSTASPSFELEQPSAKPSQPSSDPSEPPSQQAEPPQPLRYHTMGLDFDALAQNASEDVAAIHSYVGSLPLVAENEYTGLFAGKNLIMIAAESFSAEAIDPKLTPTLYRMAHQGIVFEDFYQPAWGGSTSTGEYSILMGLVPTDGVDSMRDTVGLNLYMTMGNQLQRQGYFSRAYHNNSYDYYDRDQTHENFGYEEYIGIGNGLEEGVAQTWPESDLEMIQYTVPQYIDHQPFSVYYMTVSGHGFYTLDSNAMSAKNYAATEGLNYSQTVRCYLASQLELEYAMADLLQQLEDAGIADDTVIVLCSDHYPYALEPSDSWGNDQDYLAELYGYSDETLPQQDHNALIIWSGCLEDQPPIVVDTPTYSLDILPTLSNLFGLEYDARLLVGRDVFSDAEPLVIWSNYSWKTELGYYSASRGEFTPAEGTQVPEDYISRINTIVRNRISFSSAVLEYDYYDQLFGQ